MYATQDAFGVIIRDNNEVGHPVAAATKIYAQTIAGGTGAKLTYDSIFRNKPAGPRAKRRFGARFCGPVSRPG